MSNSGRGDFSAFNMFANIVRLGLQPTNLDDVQQLLETWTGERWSRTNSNNTNTDAPVIHRQEDEECNGQTSGQTVMQSHPAEVASNLAANSCSNETDVHKDRSTSTFINRLASHKSGSDRFASASSEASRGNIV